MEKVSSSVLAMVTILPILFFSLNSSSIANAESYRTRTIKPGSCPNPFKLPKQISKIRGKLSVAILGTENFDVMTIDPDSIRLTRTGVIGEGIAPVRYGYEDVATSFEGESCDCHDFNGDGNLDLILKFNREELASDLNLYDADGKTVPLIIKGNLYKGYNGIPLQGQDCIWVLDK